MAIIHSVYREGHPIEHYVSLRQLDVIGIQAKVRLPLPWTTTAKQLTEARHDFQHFFAAILWAEIKSIVGLGVISGGRKQRPMRH